MTPDTYRYQPPNSAQVQFGPLPPGDYDFVVAKCSEPYKNQKGNWVLPVRLSILPNHSAVFANPWSGTDKNGEQRDSIAEFLHCVGRAPTAGEEPNWTQIPGARGRCHLKVETAQRGRMAGQEINTVAWFIEPLEAQERTNAGQSRQLAISPAARKAQAEQQADDELDMEPDNIPF